MASHRREVTIRALLMRALTRKLLALAALSAAGVASGVEERACQLTLDAAPAVAARCLELVVPLDPDEPDGTHLRLFAARVPSTSAAPRPDPLVLIAGGPGQSAVDLYLQAQGAFAEARRDRDLILLDQRGTGRSAVGFECPLTDDVVLETAEPAQLAAFTRRCHAALEHDPRFYTTSLAVRDLDRLREMLELEEWNLYGVSYGSRVAQHYVRRYPQHSRAVILDGVVPAELALGPDIASNAQAALDVVFARCAVAADCAAHFGDLPGRFARLRERLAAGPITVPVAHPRTGQTRPHAVSLAELNAVVRLLSYSAATAALLPLTIAEADDGNYLPLAGQARIISESLRGALNLPMHNSVACTEDQPFAAAAPHAHGYLGSAPVEALAAICAEWPAGVLEPDLKTPLRSDRPALLLSGEHDPVTPPAYAARVVATGLANAVHLIVPGQGHGMAGIGCVPRLMRAFLERPEPQALDSACLAREPVPPLFLSFNGPAP